MVTLLGTWNRQEIYFDYKKLSEIHDEIAGSGKAVDSVDPTSASYMPRGYGGVALLLNKAIG